MSRRFNYLFAEDSLDHQLQGRLASIRGSIDAIPQDQFLVSSNDDIVSHLEAKMRVESLVLHEDARTMNQSECQVDVAGDPRRFLRDHNGPFYVPGTRVEVSVPFVGEGWIFKYRTNPWSSMYPVGEVISTGGGRQGVLKLTIERPTDTNPDEFKQEFEQQMRMIREYVDRANKQVLGFNSQLDGHIRSTATDRRQRLERHSGIAALLDIPLAEKSGAIATKPIAIQARPLPKLPVPPKSGLAPEPGISSETFERVLSVIRHEGRTFETTPATFVKLGEEELRNILLAHLNGHFQGKAAGEVFRRSGKTDIRIEEDNRSAFVGECKVWTGPASVAGDLDQLLGYLTWRDSKAALVVFNKTVKGFTAVRDALIAAVKAHRCFVKELPSSEAGEWRVVMRSLEDEGRLVTVQVFAINIFAELVKEGPRIRPV